ncbi:CLC4E protein, partial [Amia calva]|nr:CLC4E protein [Amia calva]
MPFHNRCYFFSTDEMNWTSSRDNCSSMQGHLVIIETAEEQVLPNLFSPLSVVDDEKVLTFQTLLL